MKINVFGFSCKNIFSYLVLPWGWYGYLSPATKVLHVVANTIFSVHSLWCLWVGKLHYFRWWWLDDEVKLDL